MASQKQSKDKSTFQFVDNRPEAAAQRKLLGMANDHALEKRHPIQKKDNNHITVLNSEQIRKSIIQGVFEISSTMLQISYRYPDSAENHVTEQELRDDFDNMENKVMQRWHDTTDFDDGGTVNIHTANFNYIMRLDHNPNHFIIFHVDRRDNYKGENLEKTKERYDKSGDGGGKDPFEGKDITSLTSDDYAKMFNL